jgi:hypothetical protein
MNIGGWLWSLGLEQYEAAFHANAVDADVLICQIVIITMISRARAGGIVSS